MALKNHRCNKYKECVYSYCVHHGKHRKMAKCKDGCDEFEDQECGLLNSEQVDRYDYNIGYDYTRYRISVG